VAEWVDDATEPPAVLVADGRCLRCAGGDSLVHNRIGVVDDEQCAACCTVDGAGAETA
jgi:hypothetical protein